MTRTLLLGEEDYSQVIDASINHQIATLADYDFIEFVISTRGDLATGSVWNFKLDVQTMLEGKQNTVWLWNKRYHRTRIIIADNTPYLQVTEVGCPDEYAYNCLPQLYKVYGVKI